MAEDFARFGTRLDLSDQGEPVGGVDFSSGGTLLDLSGGGTPVDDAGPGRLASAGSSYARGFGQTVSGLPKSLALLSAPDPEILRNLDRIDRGEPHRPQFPRAVGPGAAPVGGDPNDALYASYQQGAPEERQRIRQEITEKFEAAIESAPFEAGAAIDQWFTENFPTNPEFQEEFWSSKVPQALGSATGFVLSSLLTRGATSRMGPAAAQIGTYAAPAALGSSLNRAQQFEDAVQSGADIATALEASDLGALIGVSEAIPVGNLLNRLDKVTGGSIKRYLVRAVQQGSEEAVQEAFSGIMNAAVAQQLYDPTRGIWTMERGEEGAVGFTTGAILETLMTLALPGRRRGTGGGTAGVEQRTPEEVRTFAQDRLRELEAQPSRTEAEERERDFLSENPEAEAVAAAYGVEIRTDTGRPDMPPPTQSDIESPIPTEIIQEGKALADEALAEFEAPPSMQEVTTDETTFERQETEIQEAPGQETAAAGPDVGARVDLLAPTEPLDVTGLTPVTDSTTEPTGEGRNRVGGPAVAQPPAPARPEAELVDEADPLEQTRANIAGESPERASLIVLRDMIEIGTDVMNDGQFPTEIREEAGRLSQRIDAALESGGDLTAIQKEATERVREWMKDHEFEGAEASELRAIQKVIEEQTALPSPGTTEPVAVQKVSAPAGAPLPSPPRRPIATRDIETDTAVTPSGREVTVRYAVVEASDLVASQTDDGRANPDYPVELQPRDRARGVSQQQVQDIARNINPRLLDRSPRAADGAPIIAGDGVVESGNGRVLALRRAYAEGRADEYRQYLDDQGYPVEGVNQPVLVRVREGEMDPAERAAFTREANERDTLGMSATERAVADATALPDNLLELYRGGDVDAAANRDFVRAFVDRVVNRNERAGMIAADGTISQEAIRRIEGTLLAKAYGDADLVATLIESADTNIRAIGGALMDVSAGWAQMRAEAQAGRIDAAMDQTARLLEAVQLVQRARREQRSVAEFVGQQDLLSGTALHPTAEFFLRLMFRNTQGWTQPAGRDKMAGALTFYLDQAKRAQPGTDLLGEPPPSPQAILTAARERQYGPETQQQGDLLAQPARRDGERDGQARGGRDRSEQSAAPARGPETARTRPERAAADAVAEPAPQSDHASWWAGLSQEGRLEAAMRAGWRTAKNTPSSVARRLVRSDWQDIIESTRAILVRHGRQEPPEAPAEQPTTRASPSVTEQPARAPESPQERRKAEEGQRSVPEAERGAGATKRDQIEDFGDVLEGARKHVWEAYRDRLREAGEVDIAAEPLSKSWPQPDYQKLIEEGADPWAVAFVRTVRDEVPNKPRRGWRLRQWVDQTRMLRDVAGQVLDGSITRERVAEAMGRPEFKNLRKAIEDRIDLYQAVGHGKSLKGVRISAGSYSMLNGQKLDPPKVIWTVERAAKATAFSNWPTHLAQGDSREEAISNFKRDYAKIDPQPKASKQVKFDIYSYRRGPKAGRWIIGKKVGKDRVDLREFEDLKEARAYLTDHRDELVKALERWKSIPAHRKESDAPRVGADHRNGADITPETFSETFGFRGVQFGNYVEGGRRQQDLNQAYDALLDLAGVLGVPARALSLNGELGLAFGARGKGGKRAPRAHYEPGTVVINLTKREGAGSLAHEWWHSLDNYFSRRRGGRLAYVSEDASERGEGVRPEVVQAFSNLVQAINQTSLRERSRGLDRRRTKPYWATGREMSARAFESYIVAKLQDQEASNDYLANIVSEDYWKAAAALGVGEGTEQQPDYPYPTAAEIPVIRAAFDDLFRVIETRETEAGIEMFSLREPTRAAYEARIDAIFADDPPRFPGVRILDRSDVLALIGFGDLPMRVMEKKIDDARFQHALTAADWKKIPDWIENPAAVFESEQRDGRLIFIAPELLPDGRAIRIVVTPNAGGHPHPVHLLLNAYESASDKPFVRWASEGLLRYVDKGKAAVLGKTFQSRLTGLLAGGRSRKTRVLTGPDLVKYREDQDFSLGAAELQFLEDFLNDIPRITTDLDQRLKDIGLSDRVRLRVVERIRLMPRAQGLSTTARHLTDGMPALIEVALHARAPHEWVLNHEAVHTMRRLGLFRDAEWRALEKAAKADEVRLERIRQRYESLNLSESEVIEEAIADTFADWAARPRRQAEAPKGFLRAALEKILGFLRALRDALTASGYRTAEDVFQAMERGEVGRRPSTETDAFRRWFGDSKVVDANGEPLVVYHGTNADFTEFSPVGTLGKRGIYLSPSAHLASIYAEERAKHDGGGANVIPAYVKIENPKVIDSRTWWQRARRQRPKIHQKNPTSFLTLDDIAELRAQGFDGIVNRDMEEIIAFDPRQVKSATGNRGTFDPDSADIRYALRPGDFDPERARRALATGQGVTFDSAESERRWQDARKGAMGQETLVTRMRDRLTHLAQGFARHYIHLPNEPRFSEAREQLRKIEAAPQASKEEAVRVLKAITKGMSRAELDLFTRKVVLDDLSFEVDREHQLPFGFTPSDVARELAKVDAVLSPALKARVEIRNRLVRKVADDLVKAGVLTREQVKNPAYYRHQVLDYARARVQYAKGAGKKLKTPHWARRMGSRLDINANLLEAEFEWLQKALTDIATARTIEWFKRSEYNVRDQVLAKARAHNKGLTDALLARDLRDNGYMKNGRETSPLNEEWMRFRQRIAIGLKKVREALESGSVDVPREFQRTAEDLMSEATGETSIFPFLSWLIDNEQPGAEGAAQAFKAINQRKAWVRAHLGDRYADPMDIEGLVQRGFAPDGYTTWQPDEGKLLFTAKTIPEHTVDRLLDRVAAEGAGSMSADELRGALESVKSLLAVGGPKYQLVVPEEIAATLNSIRDEDADGLFDALVAVPLSMWKRWVLINPRRVLKYNLNNLSGDLDAVIAGNPRAAKKLPQAIRELWQVMIQGRTPSPRYREAVERGVFDSGLTIQEIPDINYLSEFESLINPPSLKEPGRFATAPLMKVWRALQRYTWFRENWLRYAAYLDYVERLEAGEPMRTVGYGAARRKMVDAVSDPKDRAALLARELVGDYGAISHFGKGLRRKVIPFYSWLEINTKRYWRFGVNAWSQGIGQGMRTTGIIGATLGIRTTAYLTLRLAVLYGLVQLWNNLVMGDEEDELRPEERARLHLILGRDDSGQVRTLRFQGALSDFLAWFGFEQAVGVAAEIERGRASYDELVTAIAKAPVNKVVSGITPVVMAPVELLTGKSYWPDVFRPRLIRDRWRDIAQLFSVDHEYDLIFDRPSRGYGRSIEEAVVYKRDAGENAYNRMKGMSYDWLRREKGLEGSGGYVTPRSKALYDWRLAKKFGDRSAERKAYAKLEDLGVTLDDLRRSVRRAHPLGAVPLKDRAAFLRTLTSQEREMLDSAVAWYRDTYLD